MVNSLSKTHITFTHPYTITHQEINLLRHCQLLKGKKQMKTDADTTHTHLHTVADKSKHEGVQILDFTS